MSVEEIVCEILDKDSRAAVGGDHIPLSEQDAADEIVRARNDVNAGAAVAKALRRGNIGPNRVALDNASGPEELEGKRDRDNPEAVGCVTGNHIAGARLGTADDAAAHAETQKVAKRQ